MRRKRSWSDVFDGRYWVVVCFLTGLGFGVARYGDLRWGNEVINPDARRMFRPLARGVAEGGQLYGQGLADNKPPLWHLLNVGAYMTGEYTLAMLLVVGVANGLTALLLYRWLDSFGATELGILASVFFLVTFPLGGGHHINSRSVMLPFLLLAFLDRRPVIAGTGVALAALVNAYAALFVPVLLWRTWRDPKRQERSLLLYLGSGAAVGGVVVTGIAVVWGLDSANAALYWSYGFPLVVPGIETAPVHPAVASPGSYLASTWLLTHPLWWPSYAGSLVLQLLPVLSLAVVGWAHRDDLPDPAPSGNLLTAALIAGFAPFLIRAYEQYWLVPLPFIAVFAAIGVAVLAPSARVGDMAS